MFRVAVLFCAVLALAKGQTTDVSQCTFYSAPLPINMYLRGCTAQPCMLPQGQDAEFNIVFIAPRTIHQMRTTATAFLVFVPFHYYLGENEVTCNFLTNANCPVVQNQIILSTLRIPIEDFLPVGTQLPVEFRILDENDQAFVCFRLQVRITPPVGPWIGQHGAQNATTV